MKKSSDPVHFVKHDEPRAVYLEPESKSSLFVLGRTVVQVLGIEGNGKGKLEVCSTVDLGYDANATDAAFLSTGNGNSMLYVLNCGTKMIAPIRVRNDKSSKKGNAHCPLIETDQLTDLSVPPVIAICTFPRLTPWAV